MSYPPPTPATSGQGELRAAVTHMEKRCAEIEAQTAKYGDIWWPEGVVHARHMRTVLRALPTPPGDPDHA